MGLHKISPSQSQFQGVESTKGDAPVEKAKSKAAKTKSAHLEDQSDIVSKRTHYKADIRPKKEDHANFLRKCAGYMGSDSEGKVHANLDPQIWAWLQTVDSNIISQCYVDAVLLSGEYSSALADSSTLLTESGASVNFTPEQMAQIVAEQGHAKFGLNLIREQKEKSRSIFKNHLPRTVRKQYFAATSGGDLKKDYAIYCRALNFSKQISEAAQHSKPAHCQKAMEKTLSRYKNQAQFVIALKRLQNLHEKSL